MELKGRITVDELNALSEKWKHEISDIISTNPDAAWLENEYAKTFSWAKENISNPDPVFFSVLNNSDGQPLSLVEMTDARRGPETAYKCLNIVVAPSYSIEWREDWEQKDLLKITNLLAQSITQAADFAKDDSCQVLKVYGKNEKMLQIFDALMMVNELVTSFKLSRHKNWLVIELQPEAS